MKVQKVGSKGKAQVLLVALLTIIILVVVIIAGFIIFGKSTDGKTLTYNMSESLEGVTVAKVDINPGDGNLTVDAVSGGDQVLANGTLEYLEKKGLPVVSVNRNNEQANLTLMAGETGQKWNRLPWETCNGATEWQIHLNPAVQTDITAHSDGGNVKLNLAGMIITRVLADTGGGNMDLVLPVNAVNLEVTAKTGAGNVNVEIGSGITGSNTINAESGAGNVIVYVPAGTAVRVHTTSGMGKVIVDSSFIKIDNNIYQSSDYDSAVDKVEIMIKSGAGNVSVITK